MDGKRYIEKEPLIAWLKNMNASEFIIKCIDSEINFPSADVRENVYAEWIYVNGNCGCSNCRKCLSYDGNGVIIDMSHLPFCPHCNAIMTNATGKQSSRRDD